MKPAKASTHQHKQADTTNTNLLNIAEWVFASLVMLFVLGLHYINRTHVGALWRDEATSMNLAGLPSLSELWQHTDQDSAPMLWLGILQKLGQIGLTSDDFLRNLGLGIGLALCGVLWINARTFKYTFPFLTLTLLGLNAVIIRYGDSLRPYGVGMIPILLTLGLVWKFIIAPDKKNFAIAAAAATLSVHLNLHNDIQIFAICSGAAIATAAQKRWKICVASLGIGAIAATTMVVYIHVFQRSFAMANIFLLDSLPADFQFTQAWKALAISGSWLPWLWAVLFAGFLFSATVCMFDKRVIKLSETQRMLLIYSLATLLLSTVVTAIFLQHMRVVTNPWHYIMWMAVAAACLEVGFSTLSSANSTMRIARMILPALVLFFTFGKVSDALKIRLTNYDLVAHLLLEKATARDYILVNPWEPAVTFNRYYKGTAKWDTVPPVADHGVQRYDQVKAMMVLPEPADAVRPVMEKIEAALKGGGRIWLVGGLPFLPQGSLPPKLPTAPNSPYKWNCGAYTQSWLMQVAYFVQTHALRANNVPFENLGSVSEYETATLTSVEGWHD